MQICTDNFFSSRRLKKFLSCLKIANFSSFSGSGPIKFFYYSFQYPRYWIPEHELHFVWCIKWKKKLHILRIYFNSINIRTVFSIVVILSHFSCSFSFPILDSQVYFLFFILFSFFHAQRTMKGAKWRGRNIE